ncbi:MAG TPA: hypothetical protein VLB68_21350 [Pyrinomonadaceae bacterium]|nr:hypothetical protein [Pyrinomonadaceae bacterium]
MHSSLSLRAILSGSMVLALLIPFSVNSQDDDSKAIRAEVFLKARPANPSQSSAKYRRSTKSNAPAREKVPEGMVRAELGLTMWRYRPSKGADKAKELVEEDDGEEWTLERVPEETLFAQGQRVRLSFESLSREGYLYVIDREEYADGSFGDPILIFPTQKSIDRSRVVPGRLISIPSASGRFRIKPSESAKVHVAESLTIIVSKKPLIAEAQLQPKAIKLEPAQFNQWLKLWNAAPKKFEMDGGTGLLMTKTEQTASRLESPLLSQGDPAPQTIYQLVLKPDDPILITLPLRFAK